MDALFLAVNNDLKALDPAHTGTYRTPQGKTRATTDCLGQLRVSQNQIAVTLRHRDQLGSADIAFPAAGTESVPEFSAGGLQHRADFDFFTGHQSRIQGLCLIDTLVKRLRIQGQILFHHGIVRHGILGTKIRVTLYAKVGDAVKHRPAVVVFAKSLNRAGDGSAFLIVNAIDGSGEALHKIHRAAQNGMDKQGMSVDTAFTGVGALEAYQNIVDIHGAIGGDGIQRGFQRVLTCGIAPDTVAAGGSAHGGVLVKLILTVAADHMVIDTQNVGLPVDQRTAEAVEGIFTGAATGCLICSSDLVFNFRRLRCGNGSRGGNE